MKIKVTCPGCGKSFLVRDVYAGKKVRCTECGGGIPVPAPVAVTQAEPAAPARKPDPPADPPAPARRSRGLIALAAASFAAAVASLSFLIYLLVHLHEEGGWMANAPGSWYLHFNVAMGLVFPALLSVAAVGYLRRDALFGWAGGNVYGIVGIIAAIVHGSATGEAGMWMPRLVLPVITLALLNTIFRGAFLMGPLGQAVLLRLARASAGGAALILLSFGLSAWAIVPIVAGGAVSKDIFGRPETKAEVVREKQRKINPQTKYASTRLHDLVAEGDPREVEKLLDAGARIETHRITDEETPLHVAVIAGREEMVKLLLARGARVDSKDIADHTPLWLAAGAGRVKIAEILVGAGADLKVSEPNSGDTLLHEAASRWKVEFAEFLISKGADVNARNRDGKTPLAVAEGSPRLQELLRRHGAR